MIEALLGFVGANRHAVVLAIGAAAMFTVVQCTERSAVKRTDAKWVAAQRSATAQHHAAARVTETAGKAASLRIGSAIDAGDQDINRRAAAARQRVRAQASGRAASITDLPGVSDPASALDGSSGPIVAGPGGELALKLAKIDLAEDGERYRLRVQAWQDWWREQAAAYELGQQVNQPPD